MSFSRATLEFEEVWWILILPCLLELHLLFFGYVAMFVCEEQRGDGVLPDSTLRVWGIWG